MEAVLKNTVTCNRCNGRGSVPGFSHIANGTCFACHGAGSVTRKSSDNVEFVEPYPELVIPEANRATEKQWAFLSSLCGDNDQCFRRIVALAGCNHANSRYVSRKVMSAAIEIAKTDADAAKWRHWNGPRRRA
jgi:hypothetical protein